MYINYVEYEFRWNEWNIEHIQEHGVEPEEAEYVVEHARRPWPEKIGEGKWRAWGPTDVGRLLQVIYVLDPTPAIFVIHARELSDPEKHRYRRRRR